MKKILCLTMGLGLSFALLSCKDNKKSGDDYKFSVVAPNGAPAVCLANMDASSDNNDTFNYIAAELIGAQFTQKEADFIIAPVCAGAKLYKAGKSNYVFGGVVTWGNIYFASQSNISSLSDLEGKDIVLFGEGTSNYSVAEYVLNVNDVNANLSAVATAQLNQTALIQTNSIVLSAEPLITNAKNLGKTINTIDVQEEYKKLTGKDYAYTQAGLFINPDTLKDHEDDVKDFISDLKKSCDEVSTGLHATAQNCVDLGILPSIEVAKAAIPLCNINFMNAKNSKSYVEETANIKLSDFGGALPVNEFYFGL